MEHYFTHLHLHTDFSLLDGAITLDKLIAFGKQNKLPALAISDHGNIFGAVKFFQKCKKAGIKPVLGMEAYVTEDVSVKKSSRKYYHLLVLVQNEVGYKNLCKLISFSFQKGFYFKPRFDYPTLKKYSEGLIVSTACLGGHIPQLILQGNQQEAEERIDWFIDTFGRDRFYLEVQPEDQEEQKLVNDTIFEISKKKNLDVFASCDSHYVSREDHEAHEVMLAIQTHTTIDDPNRYSFGKCRVHLRTQQEMLEAFKEHPEVVWKTGEIADKCNFDFKMGELFFPEFSIPEGYTQDTFFKRLCQEGLESLISSKRIDPEKKDIYQERLDSEVNLIISMGFPGYFLIVSDFIQWAHKNGIPVGPGRGSAAGSLVAWTLQITNIDPIKYNLLFERFLNPERVSMPDIDIDFCIEGRERVIDYVRDHYGHEKVCQIITFGTMMAKGVIKDVARALGFSFEDSNAITSLIPDQLKITLKEAIEQEPRLKELLHGNPKVQKLFDIAFRLEGLTRHASKHAAGIVISPKPIDEVLPVYVPPKSNELVTQYAMTELEALGFLKIDFLGLKNLTLIANAVRNIKQNHNVSLDMNKLALDDTKTFQLISEGKTSGVFQLESEGLKDVLRKLQPERFEDVIAVNALYRPGPLGSGMVDDFIERKHGRQKVTYLLPELEPILKETNGVILYQEQVMKIASTIAGYSLGEADILRRAMGKKKVEVMAEQRKLFLSRATEKGFQEKKAGELFDLMAYFAGYGFNKSHSAAYALIAYQTAYLKTHYAAEFMASLISLEANNADKMAFYLQEATTMELAILPPDINKSKIMFTVHPDEPNSIRFGLQGIKSVGLASLENIIAEQQKKPFKDLLDFCQRIDLRTSNKRVIENLIYAGAFDSLPGNRAQKCAEISSIIDRALEYKKNAATGQMGLFQKTAANGEQTYQEYDFQPRTDLDDKEKLTKEKEVIGFYLSAHPLDTYQQQLKRLSLPTFGHIIQATQHKSNGNQEYLAIGCGLIKQRKDIVTKKGDRMSFIQLEDKSGTAEVILFPRTFAKVEPWLEDYPVFIVKGTLDLANPDKCKIKAQECIPVELFFKQWPLMKKVHITLPNTLEKDMLTTMYDALPNGKTPMNIYLHEHGKQLKIATKKKIALDEQITQKIESLGVNVHIDIG